MLDTLQSHYGQRSVASLTKKNCDNKTNKIMIRLSNIVL